MTDNEALRAHLAEVREAAQRNAKALSRCVGPHDFKRIDTEGLQVRPAGELVQRFRCTLCRGEVDLPAVLWYRRGLEHGKISTLAALASKET